MLDNPSITAFLPTIDLIRSKTFYTDVLGLNLISEDPYAIELERNGMTLRITIVQNYEPHPFTVLGFKIENISVQVEALSDKGVIFERYNSLEQDELGIWISPSGAKVAWFKDPDRNLLSVTEYPS